MDISRRRFIGLLSAGIGTLVIGGVGFKFSHAVVEGEHAKNTTGNIVDYGGWQITEDEKVGISEFIKNQKIVVKDSFDYIGGDYRSVRVANAEECASLCAEEAECKKFTYAKPIHPISDKRNMCWLKSKGKRSQVNDYYTSGYKK